jgi:septal ring factor EnvC (AmiA/AmiB activator)
MELFLYILLLGLAYYFTRVYLLKEHLTLEEVNTDYKKLDKKIDSLEEEYKSLQQKIDSQEKTMSKASSQASAINSNLSNAIAKTA